MKMLSLLAMTALLAATPVAAQSTSDRDLARDRDPGASTDQSRVKHPIDTRRHIARRRGESSYASTSTRAFDGPWSVLIETRAGACEPSFRYGVEIENGEVLNAGGAQVSLAGHVAPNGAVRVMVAAGGQQAFGAGRLNSTSGSGTWRGAGSAGACEGVWEAERRG
ncbi:MAG TPA: hypothetical protein VKW08_14505 [Xanthobacteraceae bacterium]|nr:hypothetical protein [Xanthobacteraceae bacterium]